MLYIVTIILTFIAIFIALKASHKVSSLALEVSRLRAEFLALRTSASADLPTSPAQEITRAEPAVAMPQPRPQPQQASFATKQSAPTAKQATADSTGQPAGTTQDKNFEFTHTESYIFDHLREHWLVWVGALAMLIGGGYLVQVIGSRIEFSPTARIAIAFSLSAITLAVGEWFHRTEQKNSQRAKQAHGFTYAPAAVSGAGLTGIYCTVIFAFVVYQLLSPTVSLVLLASTAFFSLALSLRQGPLMALLGLVGGYSAPLWVSGPELNYFLLAGYISAISFTATLLMQKVQTPWLSPSIAAPHVVWMLLLIMSMPPALLFPWLPIFLTMTVYLIFAVPRLGWQLDPHYRHCQGKWTHIPAAIAIVVVVSLFIALARIPDMTTLRMLYSYGVLMALAWISALRKGWSQPEFIPPLVISTVSLLALSLSLEAFYMQYAQSSILVALAISILLIYLRTYRQYLAEDHSQLAGIILLVLAPLMTLGTLFYVHMWVNSYLLIWTVFTALLAGSYFYLGNRICVLSRECFAVVHTFILGSIFVWLSGIWLTTAISVHLLAIALQFRHNWFCPTGWAIKIGMGILAVRLSLLPFIPSWQPVDTGHWLWGLVSYLPSLCILAYVRIMLQRSHTVLATWFEGAFLHVFLMTLLIHTNYWLTGNYGYLHALSFTHMVVFANQALAMSLVYGYRTQFTHTLKHIYQGYSYVLLYVFALLIALLNTFESPLLVDNVSAQALPIFNMLTLGWLIPAAVLLAASVLGWRLPHITHHAAAGVALVLGGLWLGMSIRQFWQSVSMTIFTPTGMAELFTYSVIGMVVGALMTWGGVLRKAPTVQRVGLAVLACVALKVFLWDMRALDSFWRAFSFLCLGASFVLLGWLFQKLNSSAASNR